MSLPKIEIKEWGPVPLRKIVNQIVEGINLRTPIAGCGIAATEEPDGVQISLENNPAPVGGSAGTAGGSGGGTRVDIYGAKDGAPYVFHLLQSSAPTPVP